MNGNLGTGWAAERGKTDPDSLDEIIQEVALRHGISVGRDDPILMVYTINRQVMQASASIQSALLEQQLERMKALSDQMQEQAMNRMDKSMRVARDNIRSVLREEAHHLFSQQRMGMEAANRRMQEESLRWRRLAGFSTLLSVLALATAVMLLWSGV